MSIKLNVSGRIFLVQKDILCRSQLFTNMFADCDTIDDEIMIYRSSKLFEHVYAYLLDDKYPYPKKYYGELDYYLVSYKMQSLFDPITRLRSTIEDDKEEIKSSIVDVVDAINETKHCVKNICSDVAVRDKQIDVECPVMGCTSRCMLPVCDEHRGQCCHHYDWDNYRCPNPIDEHEIYCYCHNDEL
uniref:BTB domain-containing protein n=1 Tax=viral metagenome TaxID=1070528 RepID=A0A6C0C7V3_9ZZZZ